MMLSVPTFEQIRYLSMVFTATVFPQKPMVPHVVLRGLAQAQPQNAQSDSLAEGGSSSISLQVRPLDSCFFFS